MKTVKDYNKKVLGISLKGRAQEVPQVFEELFYFCAEQSDKEKNAEMISKILKAAKCTKDIFLQKEEAEQALSQGAFVFTFNLNNLDNEEFAFPSFTEISQSQDLKAKLWGMIKEF